MRVLLGGTAGRGFSFLLRFLLTLLLVEDVAWHGSSNTTTTARCTPFLATGSDAAWPPGSTTPAGCTPFLTTTGSAPLFFATSLFLLGGWRWRRRGLVVLSSGSLA